MELLLDGELEALTRKAIERALDGDMQAIKLCLDRIAPTRKGRPVRFEIAEPKQASDLVAVQAKLLAAVAAG